MGQMMNESLMISNIIRFAARHYGGSEIVSRRTEPQLGGELHRYTYRDCELRARRLARALEGLCIQPGERVGTLAWNGHRHLELYYAVSGSGAVLHTINPRLHPEQIAYIVNHADDQLLFFELGFLPLVEAIAASCPGVRGFVAMTGRALMPAASTIPKLLCYEDLIDAASSDYVWPTFDENAAAALCYTSGTTGNPKGALYSHRSTVLHAYASAMPNVLNVSAFDTVLPVVPMFHVNAWGLPYSVLLSGAKLVLPGAALDGKSLYELFEQEGVTFSAGVPTVWLGLINYALQNELKFSTFRRTVIGGSACPPAMMDTLIDQFDVQVVHGWGMTEMSPLGTTGGLLARHRKLPVEEQRKILQKQGHAIFGVDMKIVDDDGV
jgi:fatty-acyl-CoA synthase